VYSLNVSAENIIGVIAELTLPARNSEICLKPAVTKTITPIEFEVLLGSSFI
jgi:hypothetical protein